MKQYDGNRKSRWHDCQWVPFAIRGKITGERIDELRFRVAVQIARKNMQRRLFPLTPEQRQQLHDRGYR
jgi:hypothetical protein